VVGPDVADEDALFDVFALAAGTDNRVLSLNAAANQALPQFATGELSEEADVAYLFAADDDGEALDRMLEVARSADVVVVQATRESILTRAADVVLPALDWFERSGTTVDVDGREKDVAQVLEPRVDVESDVDVVEGLLEVKA
jgi:formate dehydrogenase major subunit